MSACVQTCVPSSVQSSASTVNGLNTDIRTTNINLIANNCNNYHNYGHEIAFNTLPALQTLSTLNCSDIGIDVNSYGNSGINASINGITNTMSSKCVPSVASDSPFIQIPFGWKRELIDHRIVYYTPTNSCLQSMDELSKYLESEGTCKCGLECPLHISKTFSFDPSVASKPYDIEVAKNNNQNELCNHKRKIIALATYREHSLQTQQLIAEQQNQTRLVHKLDSDHENHSFEDSQHFQSDDKRCAQTKECPNTSSLAKHNSNKTEVNVRKSANDLVSVIQPNDSFNKSEQPLTQTVLSQLSYNCPNLLPQTINRLQNPTQRPTIIGGPQYMQTSSCETRCQYSVPLGSDALREAGNSFCLYDQNGNSGVYSFSACDSTQISVQPNEKTSIYLTPQNASNYGQMISYENPNVNLIQSTHPQAFSSETFNHYSHAFHSSDNVCNSSLSTIPSYIPLGSGNANSGAISFSTSPLSTNTITLNPTYHSSLHTSHDSPHCSQNNISILPANPPMPPLSVPNVSTVTTSVTDVIPAVGIAPQIINSTNTSGAPQVLQFINSVPLTQITANTVTVLQQSAAQDVSVPAATLIIPRLMSSHEHPVVINHAMGPQTAVFPHIANAAGLTALSSNPFQNTISIANAISLPQRTCISETGKPSRSRRRKEYNRTNRTHPPTVASILKQAALKEQEMNDKQKLQQKDQELQTNCENSESNSVTNSRTLETERSSHITQKESISVAVQSEICNDLEIHSEGPQEIPVFQSDNECNDSPEECIPDLEPICVQSDNIDENPISDSSSEHSSPSNECNGTGSDSGVESEPMAPSPSNNSDVQDNQQAVDVSRQKSIKRLKRLRKELSVYYGNDNSDDESPQSPPLPPQTRTFSIGDLVWGQMGDVRFWPGKLVTDEELIGLPIQREEGKLIVKWFGDHSLTQVEPENLKTLSEGLEEHHCARKRHRSGKRMNTCLEKAIQEAMMELDRQTSDISLSSSSSGAMSTQTIDL